MTARRTSAPEPADLRQRILDTSRALLDEQGLAALSLREVARRAGVTHQAPYPGLATPYIVAVIELQEGVRMAAGLRDIAPETVALDMDVQVEMISVTETASVPFFRPTT